MSFKIHWNGPEIAAGLEAAAARGLALAAEHLLQVANELVPIQEGTLKRSGVASSDGLTAAVSYDTPYAVRVHEDLTARHDPGRTAKYLERPFIAERETMLDIIAAEMRRDLA